MPIQKFDIFAVSIPDQKARTAVAQIVSAQSYVPLQTAMERTNTPPVLLFHNIELEGAGQHINELKALGVGFRVERLEDAPEGANADTDAGADVDGSSQPNLSAILTPDDTTAPPPPPPPPPSPPEPEPRRVPAPPGHPHHHPTEEAGVRIGGIGLDTLRKSENEKRRVSAVITAVAVAVIVAVTLLVAFLPKKYSFSSSSGPISVAKPGSGNPVGKARQEKPKKRDGKRAAADDAASAVRGQGGEGSASSEGGAQPDSKRRVISGTQKQQANSYVDSAKSKGPNLEQSAALYSIAVSFNPYNAQAWHGLVQAYRGMGRFDEAAKAETQMREIFGEHAGSVHEAVGQFGELSDAYMSDSEMYRVEYRSRKGTREDVLREVFNMTRAVRNACRCTNVSIHAYTASGKEMIVHSTEAASIHSMTDFAQKAEILWLD